ncbi:hypothetical protein ACFXG6_25390 [Streptomyces roseus]|uniref:CIS tube protein n=1 Tax=Streptomyces roseus TaxID=66430 RepID=UPI0036AD91EE
MPEPGTLRKAELLELDAGFKKALPGGRRVEVQFNPESLKVTYSTRTEQQQGVGDQRGNSPRQVVGAGATKLALQLWFDVNAPGAGGVQDVRVLTQGVTYFMVPRSAQGDGAGAAATQPVPPGVRFSWGTFHFDGMMDSLEETLDFFSPDGRPLRASLTLGLSGQLEIVSPSAADTTESTAGPTAGTRPLTRAPGGSSLQSLAVSAGAGADWHAIAEANGIENPRLLEPGRLIDLGARADVADRAGRGARAAFNVPAGLTAAGRPTTSRRTP